MKTATNAAVRCALIGLAAGVLAVTAAAQTRTLRVVTYNIAADTDGKIMPAAGLLAPPGNTNNYQAGGVLTGIGEEIVGPDPAQPLDILALQETTSNSVTVTPIVNALNAFYGVPGMFSNSAYQATESGNFSGSGNGPNALVYNARTLRLLASVPVDPPGGTGALGSASGEYREVMRYQFAPAGVATNASNIFYVYVSHYKSGTGTANVTYRQEEAQIIRNNSATLPTTARILYVGDFNTGIAGEGIFLSLTAPGINQAIDPLNPTGDTSLTYDSNTMLETKTFSPVAIHYRDDYQMMTTNVYTGLPGGLAFVPGTYHVFGNNGSISYLGSVTASGNTALNKRLVTTGPTFIGDTQLYLDLTNASDHLPVVVDYTIPVPVPRITGFSFLNTNLQLTVANSITGGVFTVLMSTNAALPLANWTALATNTATDGSFSLTVTNAVIPTAAREFYILMEK
ncbi:MAG TPA: hypothetical protein VMB80_11935 [Candidatus Acidoferrum sp.]|nr:hypothetical protein [Candidatus Acidoferrum sp.]